MIYLCKQKLAILPARENVIPKRTAHCQLHNRHPLCLCGVLFCVVLVGWCWYWWRRLGLATGVPGARCAGIKISNNFINCVSSSNSESQSYVHQLQRRTLAKMQEMLCLKPTALDFAEFPVVTQGRTTNGT